MEYNIGISIKDNRRDLTITNRFRYNNKIRIQYKCNVCGYDCGQCYVRGKYAESTSYCSSQFSRGDGCACCARKVIVPEINSIYATNPELVNYFKNIEDTKHYSIFSNKKSIFVCPECGCEKEMIISNFAKRGFSCPICSDKFSYGEKFLYSLFTELKLNFVKEFCKTQADWCNKFRYKF